MANNSSQSPSAYPLIVICGATATGKTALAVDLAVKFSGEILSVDSRQVYRGLDLGSGKDIGEYHRPEGDIPCHLIDIADPRETYSLYHYMDNFYAAFRTIQKRDRLPIACGGTGLYLEAVLKKYRIADAPENYELREELMEVPKEDLADKLAEIDPELFSETDLSSKKRIIRSLEIAWYKENHTVHFSDQNAPAFDPLVLAVTYPREELVERINQRLEERLEEGMVEEVRGLIAGGVPAERLIMLGMEYKFITEHIAGELTYNEMVSSLQTAIHRLAKRQTTWFRGMERRGTPVHWLDRGNLELADNLVKEFLEESRKYNKSE